MSILVEGFDGFMRLTPFRHRHCGWERIHDEREQRPAHCDDIGDKTPFTQPERSMLDIAAAVPEAKDGACVGEVQ